MIETLFVSYEDIAGEYYDASRHPTCANFREASAILLKKWLQQIGLSAGLLCEVGAGKSLAAELLSEKDLKAQLILTDASPSMLSYAQQWESTTVHLAVADATMLPVRSDSLDLLISSLGDPYNVPSFWNEIYRTLRPGGIAIFTTPAFDWARAFRGNRACEVISADFEIADGETLSVPSLIYSRVKQQEIIETSGLFLDAYDRVLISMMPAMYLSPKLLKERGVDPPVVEGYLIRKPEEASVRS